MKIIQVLSAGKKRKQFTTRSLKSAQKIALYARSLGRSSRFAPVRLKTEGHRRDASLRSPWWGRKESALRFDWRPFATLETSGNGACLVPSKIFSWPGCVVSDSLRRSLHARPGFFEESQRTSGGWDLYWRGHVQPASAPAKLAENCREVIHCQGRAFGEFWTTEYSSGNRRTSRLRGQELWWSSSSLLRCVIRTQSSVPEVAQQLTYLSVGDC